MKNQNYKFPDSTGHFGKYGGKFVPETLIAPLVELEEIYIQLKNNSTFQNELLQLHKDYTGRPTPLTFAERLTKYFDKAKIYLKREDLCHTGAHKINNALGQILLAKKLGKKESSPKLVLVSTALQLQQSRQNSDCNVLSTWAKSICKDKV